jgi:hypothetical protein
LPAAAGARSPLGEFTVARWNEDLSTQREHLTRIEQDVDDQVSALPPGRPHAGAVDRRSA